MNTMADALSRKERRDRETPEKEPDIYLAMADVDGQPPQEKERSATSQDHAGST